MQGHEPEKKPWKGGKGKETNSPWEPPERMHTCNPFFKTSSLQKGNPPKLLVRMQIGISTMENSMEVPQKTKYRATIWSSNSTLGYIQTKLIQKDTHTPLFIEALFTIAKTQKQLKCPSTEEWIKKMQCVCTSISIGIHTHIRIHTYSGILLSHKKNEIMPSAATWIKPRIITLSEISQKEKDKYHKISLTCGI